MLHMHGTGGAPAPNTWGWLARMCSISVLPERGSPTTKIGPGSFSPDSPDSMRATDGSASLSGNASRRPCTILASSCAPPRTTASLLSCFVCHAMRMQGLGPVCTCGICYLGRQCLQDPTHAHLGVVVVGVALAAVCLQQILPRLLIIPLHSTVLFIIKIKAHGTCRVCNTPHLHGSDEATLQGPGRMA